VDRKTAAIAAHRSQAGRVVPDAPDGFAMPSGFAEFFAAQDEVYFLAAIGGLQ
jgi:LmbE family N-acetylglucosaminyl deacetylase